MNDHITLRQAKESDIPFLVDTIVAAEKSGTDKLGYCAIFGYDEISFRQVLAGMLEEDITGQELCVSDFMIAEENGTAVSASCAWTEGEGPQASGILKANLMLFYFGADRCRKAAEEFPFVDELNFTRAPGTVQIESVYTLPSNRGRGLTGRIIRAHARRLKEADPSLAKAQIILAAENASAVNAYRKMGFAVTQERRSAHPRVAEILPATHRVMMEADIETLMK